MSEPMVSHDCVAFYLLSEEVSKTSRWSSPGRAPTRSWPGTTGTRRWPTSAAKITPAYAKVFFDRAHEDVLALLSTEYRTYPAKIRAAVRHFPPSGGGGRYRR